MLKERKNNKIIIIKNFFIFTFLNCMEQLLFIYFLNSFKKMFIVIQLQLKIKKNKPAGFKPAKPVLPVFLAAAN